MNRSSSVMKEKKRGLSDSSYAITRSAAKKKQPLTKFITLSQALGEYPQCFDETKISVVQKFVNEIDILPKEFHRIETLYLSSNNIKSLEGIQQFTCLKNLSLANNEIDDAGSLHVLEEVPTVEVLNLNGNPICRLPNYRSLVISLLPNLRSLDGKPINNEEKHKSELNLRTQSGLLDLMLTNYCELIKLNNLNRKLDVHKDLLTSEQKSLRDLSPINVDKWRKMYDFENELDENAKNIMKANLLKDVHTIKMELGLRDEENEIAFSELILRQQQKIAELSCRAEEAAKQVAALQERSAHEKVVETKTNALKKDYTRSQQVVSPVISTKSNQVTADNTPASVLDSEPKSLKSILRKNPKAASLSSSQLGKKLNRSRSGQELLVSTLNFSTNPAPLSGSKGIDSYPASTKNVLTCSSPEKKKSFSPERPSFKCGITVPKQLSL